MKTVGEIVSQANLPEDSAKIAHQILLTLGYPTDKAVDRAFHHLTLHHLTDAGMPAADAKAIIASLHQAWGTRAFDTFCLVMICISVSV